MGSLGHEFVGVCGTLTARSSKGEYDELKRRAFGYLFSGPLVRDGSVCPEVWCAVLTQFTAPREGSA